MALGQTYGMVGWSFDRVLTAVRGSMKEEAWGQFYKTCTIKCNLQVWLKLN